MKKLLSVSAIASALILGGCASGGSGVNTSQGSMQATGLGALAGALAGAAISKASGGDKTGRDAVLGALVGAAGGYVWNSKMEQQRQQMEQATKGTGIGVEKTPDNKLKMQVPADAGFQVGQANIQPRLGQVLATLASTLKTNSTTTVNILGFTDNTGTDNINLPLSQRRADTTRDYLVSQGIAAARITTQGLGASQPIADNATAAGRSENRRVEIYVTQAAETAPAAAGQPVRQ